MTPKAAAIIAVGACAWDGGFISLSPTGAQGVGRRVSGLKAW